MPKNFLPYFRVNKDTGRKYYFDSRGKFISEKRFAFLNRVNFGKGGFRTKKFVSKHGTLQHREERMIRKYGKPPKNISWVQLADKYPDRIAE